MKARHLFIVLVLLGWSAAVFGQATPSGSEFQVNTYNTGNQRNADVTMAADGSFIVVYTSDGGDGDFGTVFAQRYNANGTKRGGEFVVNSYTTSTQSSPSIDCEADGDFVVVWSSNGGTGTDTDSNSVQGQRFGSDGSSVGSQFQINTHTTSSQGEPWIDHCGNNDFVVVWSSNEQDGHSRGVYGQRYNSDGSLKGSEFAINTYTNNNQMHPQVGCDQNGDFVVAWQHDSYTWGAYTRNTIFARTYGSNGSPHQTPEFQVSGDTTRHWNRPSVDSADNGNFVVAWYGYDNPVWNYSTFARRYDFDGDALGSQFMVNDGAGDPTGSAEGFPSVGMDSDGDFIVVWKEWCGNTTCRHDILARGYNSDGSNLFSEWQVNSYTTENQDSPEIALAGGGIGRFVIVWETDESAGPDGSDSTQGQLYTSPIPVVLQKFITE